MQMALVCTLKPDIPVLSEEDPPGWEVRQHWQRYWLVDPLDGTKEFIKRNVPLKRQNQNPHYLHLLHLLRLPYRLYFHKEDVRLAQL